MLSWYNQQTEPNQKTGVVTHMNRKWQLVIAVAGILAVCALSARADGEKQKDKADHPGRGRDSASVVARMTEQLNLTAEQQDQLKPLFEDLHKQIQALRNDSNVTPEARRAKLIEIKKAHQEKVDAILTAEQKAKLAQIRADMRKNAPKREEKQEKKSEHGDDHGED
jgi:Spy/CpxP family protein refolding chaperone